MTLHRRTAGNARRIFKIAALSTTALAASALGATAANAQDVTAGEAVEATDQAAQGEAPIVVTARRRDEDLSRVPLAVTALGAAELESRGIETDADLQSTVPGLTIRQTQGNNSLTYSIRGQSADTFSSSPSAVVSYFNEVPLPVTGASTFYDLESIQVLKGPQGTLFGKNTTGGAVLYTSATPTSEFEASGKVTIGNYDRIEGEAMINVPLAGDNVALRFAGKIVRRDGYIENLYDGSRLGDICQESFRGSLRFGDEGLENVTTVQYNSSDGTNTGATYLWSVYQFGETNNGFPLNGVSALLFSPAVDGVFMFPGLWNDYLAANPAATAGGLVEWLDIQQNQLGPYRTYHPSTARHQGEDILFSNRTTIDLSDTLRLRNIFGWMKSDVDSEQPQLGAPYITILTANVQTGDSGNEVHLDSWTEELQLQGEAFGGALDFILGGYIQRQKTDTLFPQTYFYFRPVIPASAATVATNHFRTENNTDALYAQGTYDLGYAGLEGLSITAGFRYTWETVRLKQLVKSIYFGAADQEAKFSEPSWEVGLEYLASPDWFLYAKTRGSFRTGGFNGTDPPPDLPNGVDNSFDAETTEDIEVGAKYSGYLMGRPANFSIAGFWQWIHDVQRVEFPDPDGPGPLASVAITANVPEERVRGIEFQGSVSPAEWLRVGASGAYTDADFTDNQVTIFGVNYAWGPVADTPEFSGVLWAEFYAPTAPEVGDITFRAEAYTQSSFYFSNTADGLGPRTRLPSYTLVSARLAWDNIMDSGLSAAVFAKNLFDEEYFVGGMPLATALGHNSAVVGEPRMYGMELSFSF